MVVRAQTKVKLRRLIECKGGGAGSNQGQIVQGYRV